MAVFVFVPSEEASVANRYNSSLPHNLSVLSNFLHRGTPVPLTPLPFDS